MERLKAVVEKSISGRVVGVFCSRDCAETRMGLGAPGCRAQVIPALGGNLAGYALGLLTCDECGDNIYDVAVQRASEGTS